MQLAIELPDELGQKLLQHPNVQQFVQEAICVMLLKEEQTQAQKERSLPLLALINSIEPVKTRYSSEEMVSLLRAGKEQFLIDMETNHAP